MVNPRYLLVFIIASFISCINDLKKNQIPIQSVQGKNSSDWILLDLGNIVINIMSVSARQYYDLESLWDDSLA